MNKRLRNDLLRCERGSQTIEFVGILPLFLLMILIVWQFALAAGTYITAKSAAMEAARVAMVDNDYNNIVTAARNVAPKAVVDHPADDGTLVTVTVHLDVPLLNSPALFNTTGLRIPVQSSVTVRKEK